MGDVRVLLEPTNLKPLGCILSLDLICSGLLSVVTVFLLVCLLGDRMAPIVVAFGDFRFIVALGDGHNN